MVGWGKNIIGLSAQLEGEAPWEAPLGSWSEGEECEVVEEAVGWEFDGVRPVEWPPLARSDISVSKAFMACCAAGQSWLGGPGWCIKGKAEVW